jgi:hypothetical protein
MTVDADSYPLELPRILLEENTTEGFLLLGAFLSEAFVRWCPPFSPMVLVDAYASTISTMLSCRTCEWGVSSRHVLIQQGHRHIAFVGSHRKPTLAFMNGKWATGGRWQMPKLPNPIVPIVISLTRRKL